MLSCNGIQVEEDFRLRFKVCDYKILIIFMSYLEDFKPKCMTKVPMIVDYLEAAGHLSIMNIH